LNAHPHGKAFSDANVSIRAERELSLADGARALTVCPCCSLSLPLPPLDILMAERGIKGHAAAVLIALWEGRGFPVLTERLFDALYADDPDGGPSPAAMYRAMHSAIDQLNARLGGSGIVAVNAGYRQGWRLRIFQSHLP